MKILLVSGHEKLKYMTKALRLKGHDVTIVSEDQTWCRILSNTYEVVSVHGDGTDPEILKEADTGHMDMVIALSNTDSSNLITCELAEKQFHVKHTISIVNDPCSIKLFEDLGVNKCISTTQMLMNLIEQSAVPEKINSYLPVENGKIIVHEIKLESNSPLAGKKLWGIDFPKESTVCCIIRGEQTIIPQGNIELKAEDNLIIVSKPEAVEKINLLLSRKKG